MLGTVGPISASKSHEAGQEPSSSLWSKSSLSFFLFGEQLSYGWWGGGVGGVTLLSWPNMLCMDKKSIAMVIKQRTCQRYLAPVELGFAIQPGEHFLPTSA